MHELRSAILSGDGVRPDTPVAPKKPPKMVANRGSLTAIPVRREESRLSNERREERHRNIVDSATLHFRRRKYDVAVINVSSGGIMIESDIEPRIGEAVEIQIADCNRTKCAVRWVRENRIGLEFQHETTIIGSSKVQEFIIRRLRGEAEDRPADEVDAKPNRSPRHGLIWVGTLHFDHDSFPVRLRNISAEGAMLETEQKFEIGAEVLLDLEEAGTAFAKVCWFKGGQMGVKFDHKFNLKNLADCKPAGAAGAASGTNGNIYMLKPEYLQSETSPTSPWAAMWDRLTVDELASPSKIRR